MELEAFKTNLRRRNIDDVVKTDIFQGTPHVFKDDLRNLDLLLNHLTRFLPIQSDDITIVGSAKTGFSLAPDTFPTPFSDTSDVDVIIVNAPLFDDTWHTLLRWNYPHRRLREGKEGRWISRHQKDIYWGWFRPDKLRYPGVTLPASLEAVRDFRTRWFAAFRSLGTIAGLATRDFHGRLYRTWDHATSYHAEGLRRIREMI